jgi:hypothetical protein
MTITYICPHCRTEMGRVERNLWSEFRLGFPMLTEEERDAMISYSDKGDMVVTVSCEYCEEATHANPELYFTPTPIQ